MRKIIFSKEWIESLPKTINDNGCWIPVGRLESDAGYIRVESNGTSYSLHRVVLALYYNIDYFNYDIETRHGLGCDRRCFNYSHLLPGSPKDNMRDVVDHGHHVNSNKSCCPRCGGPYVSRILKSGINKGKIKRHCRACKTNLRRERDKRSKI